MKDLVGQYLKKSDKILNIGAGNSRLTEEMYEDGEIPEAPSCSTGSRQGAQEICGRIIIEWLLRADLRRLHLRLHCPQPSPS